MPATDLADADGALLEECIDEIEAAMEKLERFPETVVAFALRAHLAGLLNALADRGQLTPETLTEFVRGLALDSAPSVDAD